MNPQLPRFTKPGRREPQPPGADLTLEVLLSAFAKCRPTNPFVELAEKHGCDITKEDGDLLVIPTGWLTEFPEIVPFTKLPGLKVSGLTGGQAYLLNSTAIRAASWATFAPPPGV